MHGFLSSYHLRDVSKGGGGGGGGGGGEDGVEHESL